MSDVRWIETRDSLTGEITVRQADTRQKDDATESEDRIEIVNPDGSISLVSREIEHDPELRARFLEHRARIETRQRQNHGLETMTCRGARITN